MSECASRMANHHVATVPESLERAPIEVSVEIRPRGAQTSMSLHRGGRACFETGRGCECRPHARGEKGRGEDVTGAIFVAAHLSSVFGLRAKSTSIATQQPGTARKR